MISLPGVITATCHNYLYLTGELSMEMYSLTACLCKVVYKYIDSDIDTDRQTRQDKTRQTYRQADRDVYELTNLDNYPHT